MTVKKRHKALLVDTDRQSQAPYIIYDFWKNHSDEKILKAQQWMGKNYENKFSIDAVAEFIGISPLMKHTGLSPKDYRNKFSYTYRDKVMQ